MLSYWQHHPALSYAFSGRFVGPTSQAPRIDEARHESLYELEIAFDELERLSREGTAPALAGRSAVPQPAHRSDRQHPSRRVLHRQALQPGLGDRPSWRARAAGLRDGATRADELVQALLVRALVARLWQDPHTAGLVRWGTELHDRFMLPWWRRAGPRGDRRGSAGARVRVRARWFAPFLEFRFPRSGRSRSRASRWSSGRRSSRGTCSGRSRPRPAPRATSIPRSQRLEVRVEGMHRRPLPRHLQRPHACRCRRPRRRDRGCGRALPGAIAVVGPASDDRRAGAAHLRPGRSLDRALARRLPVPRQRSRRAGVRPRPDQRRRGRGTAPEPLRAPPPHRRRDRSRAQPPHQGIPSDARSAARRLPPLGPGSHADDDHR